MSSSALAFLQLFVGLLAVFIAALLFCTDLGSLLHHALVRPLSSQPIEYQPDPTKPAAPERKQQQPPAALRRAVQERLSTLRKQRVPENAAYSTAVWKFKEWPETCYTGLLRPGIVSPRRKVPKSKQSVHRPDYSEQGKPLSEIAEQMSMRRPLPRVLTSKEIAGMRRAGRLGREVIDIAAMAVQPGVRCDEIDAIVHEACLNRGCYPSPLNYMTFPKSVCTSVNEVICHGVPDSYELKRGDIINIDVTVYYAGFHADLNETYFVGGRDAMIDDEPSVRLVQTAYECLFRAIETVKPGELYRNLGNVIQPLAESNGCSVSRTYMGHGVNTLFHTSPSIPHYAHNKAIGMMAPGHAFTIEPMLNLGGWRDKQWPDGWTAVTADGSRSAQFEHTLLVTEDGVEILTARTPTSRADVATNYRGEIV